MPSISKRPNKFVYYICCRWDRDQSGKYRFSDESMEPKNSEQQLYFSDCSAYVCVRFCEGRCTHRSFSKIPCFFFLSSFSLTTLGLFTRACYITTVPWQREMDCVGRGWRFGEYIILVFCVGLCASEDTLCICIMYDSACSCFVERAADIQM